MISLTLALIQLFGLFLLLGLLCLGLLGAFVFSEFLERHTQKRVHVLVSRNGISLGDGKFSILDFALVLLGFLVLGTDNAGDFATLILVDSLVDILVEHVLSRVESTIDFGLSRRLSLWRVLLQERSLLFLLNLAETARLPIISNRIRVVVEIGRKAIGVELVRFLGRKRIANLLRLALRVHSNGSSGRGTQAHVRRIVLHRKLLSRARSSLQLGGRGEGVLLVSSTVIERVDFARLVWTLLPGALLRGRRLTGAILRGRALLPGVGILLRGHTLLSGAMLRSRRLSGTMLRDRGLTGAILRSRRLCGTILRGRTLLPRGLLRGRRLTETMLTGTILTRTVLRDRRLSGAILRSRTLLPGVGVLLRDRRLSGAILRGRRLSRAMLRDGKLSEAVRQLLRTLLPNVLRVECRLLESRGSEMTLTRRTCGERLWCARSSGQVWISCSRGQVGRVGRAGAEGLVRHYVLVGSGRTSRDLALRRGCRGSLSSSAEDLLGSLLMGIGIGGQVVQSLSRHVVEFHELLRSH